MTSAGALIIFSLLFISESQAVLLVTAATLVGFNYGTNLSLFPSVTKDYFGLKNFGLNYGLIFSAWGIGGFIFPRVSQMIVARTGTMHSAYIMCSILLMASALIALMTKAPAKIPSGDPVWTRISDNIVFARSQPADVYLGARHI